MVSFTKKRRLGRISEIFFADLINTSRSYSQFTDAV